MSQEPNLSQFWDLAKSALPFPAARRIYENAPSSHPSWKAVMAGSTLSLMNAAAMRNAGQKTPLNTQNEALVSMRAAQHDFPLFWIDRSFLESLLRTDPPVDLTLADIKWPFPALAFILPKNTLVHDMDGDCSWLMIGRIGGDSHKCPLTGDQFSVRNTSVCAFTIPWERENPATFNYAIPDEPDFAAFRPFPDLGPGTLDDYNLENPSASDNSKLSASDTTLSESTLQLGLRLLLALTARPEFIGSATADRPAKGKDKQPRAFATPRWIGKDYAIKVDPSAPDLSSGKVRMHWRRGHFRNQPHGEGRLLRKVLWIEPYLVGKPGA